jgi:cytochrome c peroxidase
MAVQPAFYLGINALGGDPVTGQPFDRAVFTIFDAWTGRSGEGERDLARARIAHGQALFNQLEFDIRGVAGMPDTRGTCSTCHNAPNVGSHSEFLMLSTGTADASRRTPDLPLLTVWHQTTGQALSTQDLGRALVSGLWADIGKFKVPTLRGLAARAPYLHDGSAPSIRAVIAFYAGRFGIDFQGRESDLVAFLASL